MVTSKRSGALSGGSATDTVYGATGTAQARNGRVVADGAAVERLLGDGNIDEVMEWLDSLLGQPERRSTVRGSEQEARRHVSAKLKWLATLKRATEALETMLRRQQTGLALELTPGLSDRCVSGQSQKSDRRSYPLSYAQQQMVALQQMHPDRATYNITRALRVTAKLPLDPKVLRIAVQRLLDKHETLRTIFALDPLDGEPRQIVLPAADFRIDAVDDHGSSERPMDLIVRVVDWAGSMQAYTDDQAIGAFVAASKVSAPFDLTRELPVRIFAIQAPPTGQDNGENVSVGAGTRPWTLVAVLHHIATDGASTAIFWRDLFEAYSSSLLSSGPTSHDKLLQAKSSVRYRDYAVWQRERVESGALDASVEYWRRQFDPDENDGCNPAPLLELPSDKRSARASDLTVDLSRGDIVQFQASSAAFARMSALCQAHGCSLYMGLLAAFYVLLSRLSGGAADITIGTPVSARDREELQHIMGYFVNTLPLRIRGSSDRGGASPLATAINNEGSFAELLQAVRGIVLDAFAHREVPFHKILERVRAAGRRRRQAVRASYHETSHALCDDAEMDESRLYSLYQVMFALEQHGVGDGNASDCCEFGRELELPHAAAKFDLMLTMRVMNQRHDGATTAVLEGEMEFPINRFTRSSVERFACYYCELLEQVTLVPDTPLRAISMLPRDEQEKIVDKWGTPPVSPPPPPPPLTAPRSTDSVSIGAFASPFIDECLGQQVRLTPTNWALHFDGASWSYATLWRESGRVLNGLTAIYRDADNTGGDGGRSQLRIGLFLARGLANAAAIVGVMRARAVFVPLDVSFPRERLRYMIRDADLHAIVTQHSHADKLSDLLSGSSATCGTSHELNGADADCAHVHVLAWEDLAPVDGNVDRPNGPTVDRGTDAAAYILYTSGSTGSPKGVVVSHGNLLTTLRWTIRAYHVSSGDTFLQSTSCTLDGSLTQLLSPLLAGGAAVITRDGGLHDLEYMRSLLLAPRPRAVTYCVFVPSYLSTLLDYHDQNGDAAAFCFPPTLRHVVVVGEAFPMELARKFYRLLLRSRAGSDLDAEPLPCLVNEYGPTEAAVTSTFFRLPLASVFPSNGDGQPDRFIESDTVPIGSPIDGRRALVLDACGRLVPPHVRGELFLGGQGVSIDGYWRRPDVTKAAFVQPEFSGVLRSLCGGNGARWYRTGDVVKWRADGSLVFIGRVDAQVKLRGQRVEPNEVRNVLLRHDSVADAEVRVVSSPSRGERLAAPGPRLVAFVILASHWSATRAAQGLAAGALDDLTAFARERLPLHMVPHEIRAVARWPRTPNGKLDVRALLDDAPSSAVGELASSSAPLFGTKSSAASPRTRSDRDPRGSDGDSGDDDDDDSASSLSMRVTRELLAQIWCQVLELDADLAESSSSQSSSSWRARSFFSLGGDSLAAIRAISLARARGISLTLDAFFTSASVSDMAARALATAPAAPLAAQTLVPLNVAPVRAARAGRPPLTLFLVHCADGTVWKLLELASLLPFRVVGVQATRAAASDSVEAMASRYWAEIRAMQPRGPYALGGFSFGCRVAHELARVASRAGHALLPLTLLDGAPFPSAGSYALGADVDAYVSESFGGRQPRREADAALFAQLAAQFRAHCAMERAYQPRRSGAPAEAPLAAVVYKTDRWELDAEAARAGGVAARAVTFPGCTHLSLLRRPHVAKLARAVREQLEARQTADERRA